MNLELRPFDRDDFQRLLNWIQTEEDLVQWCGPFFAFPLDMAQLEAYLDSANQQPPPRRIFKAVDREREQVVGHIEINNIDRRNLAATLSKVFVDPTLRGRGIGAEMVRQAMRVAFDEMGLHRMELRVFDFNTPAVRCYQKLGFQIEGHLRDYRKVGDQYWSSYLMACLEDVWKSSNPQR